MYRLSNFAAVRHIDCAASDPQELEPGTLYIVDGPKWLQWRCPCGCGRLVSIPYCTGAKQPRCWRLINDGSGVTLEPSILSGKFPCKSHYFVRKGEIVWL